MFEIDDRVSFCPYFEPRKVVDGCCLINYDDPKEGRIVGKLETENDTLYTILADHNGMRYYRKEKEIKRS